MFRQISKSDRFSLPPASSVKLDFRLKIRTNKNSDENRRAQPRSVEDDCFNLQKHCTDRKGRGVEAIRIRAALFLDFDHLHVYKNPLTDILNQKDFIWSQIDSVNILADQ